MASNGYTAQEMIDAIQAANGVLTQAAKNLGCTRQTVYNYCERYVTVQAALDEAREVTKDFAESKLVQHIREGNVTALIFYLKTQAKDRGYVERQELAGVQDGAKIKVSLTDD